MDVEFEYIRARGSDFTTRPTTRTHVDFAEKDGKLTANLVEPSLLKSMLEMHMGHGPRAYKVLGAIAGLVLLLVVFGGLLIGLLSPAYRKPTIFSALFGTAVFVWVAFLA